MRMSVAIFAALAVCTAVGAAADAVTARPPAPVSDVTVVRVSKATSTNAHNTGSQQSTEGLAVGDGIDSSASAALKDLGDELGKIILIILGISIAVCVCGVLLVVFCCCGGIACIAKLCSDEQRNQQQQHQQYQQQQYQQQSAYVAVQPGQYPQPQAVPQVYAQGNQAHVQTETQQYNAGIYYAA